MVSVVEQGMGTYDIAKATTREEDSSLRNMNGTTDRGDAIKIKLTMIGLQEVQ